MMVTRLCKSVMSRAFFLIFTISNNAWGKCSVTFNQFNGLLRVTYVAVGGGSFFFKMQSWQAKTMIKKANHNKGGGVENTYFYFHFNVNYPTITFFIFSKKSGRGRSSFKIQFFICKIIRKLPVAREKFPPPPYDAICTRTYMYVPSVHDQCLHLHFTMVNISNYSQ